MMWRWLPIVGVMASAAVMAGCGNAKKAATPPVTTTKAAVVTPTPKGGPSSCSSYGSTWRKSYNRSAILQGSPIRMLAACCGPATKAGRHHCFLKVTLVGTQTIGCETVDLGSDGTPATIGRHENCALHK
jgi:hypothetical protein